jgi:transposase-like protein
MPIAHFSFSPRTTMQTQSATDVVHYLTREGAWLEHNQDKLPDRDVAYLTREAPDVQARNDLVASGVRNLPDWAQDNATVFFQEAARSERINGQYAYVLQFSLPRSLTHAQQMALAEDFLSATMPDKPLLWVKHEPVALDGQPNPHLHVMLSGRMMDDIARSPSQFFARFNPDHPERGGARKDRFWVDRVAPRQLRMAFTDITNYHLERADVSERLDPRRLSEQGIDRPSFGKASRGQTLDRDIAAEQAKATLAWEQRKGFKGIANVHTIPREAFVLQVRQWMRSYERGTAIPTASAEVVKQIQDRTVTRLTAELRTLEKLQAALKIERAIEERYAAMGKVRPQPGVERMEKLLASVGDPGAARRRPAVTKALQAVLKRLGHDDHTGAGAALAIRLQEEEDQRRQHAQHQGMGL